jgi:hypothetical protein
METTLALCHHPVGTGLPTDLIPVLVQCLPHQRLDIRNEPHPNQPATPAVCLQARKAERLAPRLQSDLAAQDYVPARSRLRADALGQQPSGLGRCPSGRRRHLDRRPLHEWQPLVARAPQQHQSRTEQRTSRPSKLPHRQANRARSRPQAASIPIDRAVITGAAASRPNYCRTTDTSRASFSPRHPKARNCGPFSIAGADLALTESRPCRWSGQLTLLTLASHA